MTRRIPAWATVLAIIAALTLLPAAPAAAAPFDCKEAPTATQPAHDGPANLGARASQDPTGADPFVAGSGTTIYREYGWPTTWWPTYDLGCGPDIARNPSAVVGSFIADTMAGLTLGFATSFDSLVHAVLDWKGLEAVDASIQNVVTDLRADLWAPLITIMLLLTAAWFIIKVMRGDTGSAAKAAGVTLVAAFALVIVVNYPQKSAQLFDSTVKGAVAVSYSGALPDADSGTEIADGLVSGVFEATMYDRWCEGMVGGGTASADQWCPRLWKSLYLSRTESALTGAAKHDLIDKKKDQFEEVAEEIKDKDPSAYAVLTGSDYQTRIFAAGSAAVVWPLVSLFPVVALFLLLVALMLLRVAVMLAPIAGPILIHPAARRIGRSTVHVFGAALLNAVLFGAASAIFLRVEVAIMASTGMPIAVRLVALAVLMVAFWVITKPFRRLRQMRPRKSGEPEPSAKGKHRTNKLVVEVKPTNHATTTTVSPPIAEAGNR